VANEYAGPPVAPESLAVGSARLAREAGGRAMVALSLTLELTVCRMRSPPASRPQPAAAAAPGDQSGSSRG
jgi:hypothetical protein